MRQFLLLGISGFGAAGFKPKASKVCCDALLPLSSLMAPHGLVAAYQLPFLSGVVDVHPVAQGLREGAILVSEYFVYRAFPCLPCGRSLPHWLFSLALT
jgi:hypothetical protein